MVNPRLDMPNLQIDESSVATQNVGLTTGLTQTIAEAIARVSREREQNDSIVDDSSEFSIRDEPWDEDPWLAGQNESQERKAGFDQRSSTNQDGVGSGHDRRVDGSLPNPYSEDSPSHPIMAVHEAVQTPTGRVQLSTEDEAPANSTIRQTVYLDTRPYLRDRFDYRDLLSGNSPEEKQQEILACLEEAHKTARERLVLGGLDGLDWKLVSDEERL